SSCPLLSLPRFPTRRSSDLSPLSSSFSRAYSCMVSSILKRCSPLSPACVSRSPEGNPGCNRLLLIRVSTPSSTSISSRPSKLHRSEEHTSELQSLGHLVCRL